MRYALIFDAHIGAPGWERWYPTLRDVVEAERSAGATIVWAGDTLDQVADSSIRLPDGLYRDGDIWLLGNHDPYVPEGVEARHHLLLGDTLVVHGDAVDFQYLGAVLHGLTRGRIRREHALLLYQAFVGMPDWATKPLYYWAVALLRGRPSLPPWRLILATLPALVPLLCVDAPRLFPDPPKDLPLLNPLDRSPSSLMTRLRALYGHLPWRRAVMGHLHPEEPIEGEGLLVSLAWPTFPVAGYVVWDDGEVRAVRV